MRFLLAAICLLFASGCASIIDNRLQPLSVTTVMDNKEVAGSGCTLTNDEGKWFVTTPGSVMVHKSTADLAVDCSKENVGAGTQTVESSANGGVWGNIIFGGLVGYVVDRNTGAGFDYPTMLTIALRPYSQAVSKPSEPTAATGAVMVPVALQAAQTDARPVPPAPSPVPAPVPAAAPGDQRSSTPLPTGQDSFQVQKLAKASSCAADPLAVLTSKGPGYEHYSVKCADGDALIYRCEFGNCRVLK